MSAAHGAVNAAFIPSGTESPEAKIAPATQLLVAATRPGPMIVPGPGA